MYHDYPHSDGAYACPQQYTFGSELIAAPYTSPADPDTRLSRQLVWLPPGDWYNFFSGNYYSGDRWLASYGRLDEIPVFARAGAIVPLGPKVGWGGIENPAELDLHVYAGANNEFILYEDDGETTSYQDGAYCLTAFTQEWEANKMAFRISAVSGQTQLAPERRQYQIFVYGLQEPETVQLQINGQESACRFAYHADLQKLVIYTVELSRDAQLSLRITQKTGLLARQTKTLDRARKFVSGFRMETMAKSALYERLPEITADLSLLATLSMALTTSQMQCLLEVLLEAGAYQISGAGQEDTWLLWNNNLDERARYSYVWENTDSWAAADRFVQESGTIPRMKVIELASKRQLTLKLVDYSLICE
jgi:hypothetical protein